MLFSFAVFGYQYENKNKNDTVDTKLLCCMRKSVGVVVTFAFLLFQCLTKCKLFLLSRAVMAILVLPEVLVLMEER